MSEEEIIKWNYQRYVKDYLRCVRSVDDGIGKILDYLDESGLAENTIVIYASDQGWYLGDHGWYDKRWMYEESFRTPLMIRWPGVTRNSALCKQPVVLMDLFPTLLSAAGVTLPANVQLDGVDLAPLLKNQDAELHRDALFFHYPHYYSTTTPVGAPECGMLNAGAPRLAQKYMLPSFAAGG